jgi:hypothetical protein
MVPAPSTSARRPGRPPSARPASATQTDAVDVAPRPMPVSRRTRRPQASAWRNTAPSSSPRSSWAAASAAARRTWCWISGSPTTAESRPAATRNRCAMASSPRWAYPAAATPAGLTPLRPASAPRSASTAAGAFASAYSSVRLHVDRTAAAESSDRAQVAEQHAGGRLVERDALAEVDRRGVVRDADRDERTDRGRRPAGHRLFRYSTTSDCSRAVSPRPKQAL